MESFQGKHFSITDPKDIKTVIYQINKTEKELSKQAPKFTVERLEYTEEINGEFKKKTFFVDELKEEGNQLVILSFGKDRVVVNSGILLEDRVHISRKPLPLKFDTLYSEKKTIYKEFSYTPNLKRPISIIDPETAEEIKPVLFLDEDTKQIKGKCRLKPNKPYFAFEIGKGN